MRRLIAFLFLFASFHLALAQSKLPATPTLEVTDSSRIRTSAQKCPIPTAGATGTSICCSTR